MILAALFALHPLRLESVVRIANPGAQHYLGAGLDDLDRYGALDLKRLGRAQETREKMQAAMSIGLSDADGTVARRELATP